jgi:hypothetical protein
MKNLTGAELLATFLNGRGGVLIANDRYFEANVEFELMAPYVPHWYHVWSQFDRDAEGLVLSNQYLDALARLHEAAQEQALWEELDAQSRENARAHTQSVEEHNRRYAIGNSFQDQPHPFHNRPIGRTNL